MDELRYVFEKTGRLDHAYLLAGDLESLRFGVRDFLSKDIGVKIENNTDCLFEEFESFGIDESRRLKGLQANKGFSGANRYFVVSTSFFTVEAQNALLKMFEEPRDGVFIFLIVPTLDMVIDTLLSRLQVVGVPDVSVKDKDSIKEPFYNFVTMTISERLKIIKKLTLDKEKKQAKIKALKLLDVVEERIAKDIKKPDIAQALEEIIFARKYLYGRSPSLKMILEHIALVIPITK